MFLCVLRLYCYGFSHFLHSPTGRWAENAQHIRANDGIHRHLNKVLFYLVICGSRRPQLSTVASYVPSASHSTCRADKESKKGLRQLMRDQVALPYNYFLPGPGKHSPNFTWGSAARIENLSKSTNTQGNLNAFNEQNCIKNVENIPWDLVRDLLDCLK